MAKLPSFLERFEYYKNLLKPIIKNKSDEEVRAMLCHCRYYKAGRMKKISQEERILYDLLEKNNLSASTIYEYYTS
ncbi:hypothetical protein HY837_03805, partial [archaeon]|nr:hypothetical protein [archaeon]